MAAIQEELRSVLRRQWCEPVGAQVACTRGLPLIRLVILEAVGRHGLSFHFIVRFEPLPGKEAAYREELLRVNEPSRAETGCLSFHVFEPRWRCVQTLAAETAR